MGFSEDQLFAWFAQYAYQPGTVYFLVCALMLASSFGLPFPEEVTLVSLGVVCYMGSRPDLFPPPFEGAPKVNVTTASIVAFCAVFLSDFLVFSLGKFFGGKLINKPFLASQRDRLDKVSSWVRKYGAWAAGIFRFTPGLRFPGHFSCGMLGLQPAKFIAVDGVAALISVPSQVILIAVYGETILEHIKEAKIVFFGVLAVVLAVYFIKKKMAGKAKAT